MNQTLISQPVGAGRTVVAWYCYFLLGFFVYLLNIQGNILPFLQTEFALSYGIASLHSSALAVGLIIAGLCGDLIIRCCGRRLAFQLAITGCSIGAALLCVAPAAWASIGSCVLIGMLGGLFPGTVAAVLAEMHGETGRNVAYAEANAFSYIFAIVGPLVTGFFIMTGVGWRGVGLLGAVFGAILLVTFRRTPIANPPPRVVEAATRLPALYWAYWVLITAVISIELCTLFWAPAYLERVVSLSKGSAAASAAVFSLGMLGGRIVASRLVWRFAPDRLLHVAFAVALLGFLTYWGSGWPPVSVAGLFLLGLGAAPMYPLSLGLAVGAAGEQRDAASARVTLAVGLAILVVPAAFGILADVVGLWLAHLILPGLVCISLLCLLVAHNLECRRPAAAKSLTEVPPAAD